MNPARLMVILTLFIFKDVKILHPIDKKGLKIEIFIPFFP